MLIFNLGKRLFIKLKGTPFKNYSITKNNQLIFFYFL